MTANFFSNNDSNLPNIKLKGLPKISKRLPKLEINQNNDNLWFDTENGIYTFEQFTDDVSNLFFNS